LDEAQGTGLYDERLTTEGAAAPSDTTPPPRVLPDEEVEVAISSHSPLLVPVREGVWHAPSEICANPDQARACMVLPAFEGSLLQSAHAISEQYPLAETRYRQLRGKHRTAEDVPHFEKVFRIAAALAGVRAVQERHDYDELLVLTAWNCVRPRTAGFLASYPKSLLCPLSHAASPAALNELSSGKRQVFDRRAPIYVRYLLLEKFALHTCAEIENADLRDLLRRAGFRLIRPSAAPEIAFPGITQGEDPPVRPWKLALRQELSDERAAQMLVQAALWQIKFGLRLVTMESNGTSHEARWNIGGFGRTDWEDAFLSTGVRVSPSLMRESGLLDWRAVLARCVKEIGAGNLPPEVVGKVLAQQQRVSHDSHQAVWEVLDDASRRVVERVRQSEPDLFNEHGELHHETARVFRRWARLFDEVSPNILSRFGVSAFTALHRIAPEYFGWGPEHLKPWELEQEHGKWKGPRGRALLRSAYAFALHEAGLGSIETHDAHVVWQCTASEFSEWTALNAKIKLDAYEFLYGIASQHGLTPLLNREVTHTAAISLLAGMNLHDHLPTIEGCWEVCVRSALELHGGKLEVRLALPDLVPLPLRLRKAVLAPLTYSYLHKEIRLVREFDLRMARESHRNLEEVPGWWDDERIVGTPLLARVSDAADPARAALNGLQTEPWLEPRRLRFGALRLLISRGTTEGTPDGKLSSDEIRALLGLALETLDYTNIAQVSLPAVRRGFERILARDDTREMIESLLLHVGAAYETEAWGQVRKFIVLDAINDLLALVVRNSLLHVMSGE
jgi:hypothetical protein